MRPWALTFWILFTISNSADAGDAAVSRALEYSQRARAKLQGSIPLYCDQPTATDPFLQVFCNDPYEAVCGDGSFWGNIKIDGSKTKAKFDPRRIKQQEEALDPFSSYWKTIIEDLKSTLSDTIEQNQKLTRAEKQKMQTALRTAERMRGADFVALGKEQVDQYRRSCGNNGSRINAFYFDEKIVICLGALWLGEDKARNGPGYNRVVGILRHEIGHAIAEIFTSDANPYASYLKCLHETLGLGESEQDMLNRSKEVVSDFWAAESLAVHLERTKDVFGRAQILTAELRTNLELYCTFSKGSERHLDTVDRLNLIFGRHSRLRNALGCGPVTSCTL